MLFCSIKGANRGYIQVLLATNRNRIYFRRRSIDFYKSELCLLKQSRLILSIFLILSSICKVLTQSM
ncbi:hypothetical protein [Cardinium endosymbiont of Tipula unca]|uniref:hypothetical protein n=1 Tax=Cardinium endosymbiont of Tipula unca TaxID=3066216 RepID=UPI0030CC710A